MLILLLIFLKLLNGIELNNQFIEEPKDVETIIGSTIILRCQTEPIHPNQVTWCKNDFCTLGKTRDLPFYPRYEIIGDANQGEHHFKIINVSLEDIGMYQCQIRAGPKRAGSMSRKAKLTILQIPTNLSIDSPVILIENVPSFVICRSTNGMPEAKLTWNYSQTLKYLSKTDYALISDQSLRNSISNLSLIGNEFDHGKTIECQAHSSAIQTLNQTLITKQLIQIHFLPKIDLISKGNFNENENLTIISKIRSRPNVDLIEWFNGTNSLNLTNQTRFNLILTRFMHNNRIFCRVTNQIGTTNQSIQLKVNYYPRFVKNSSVVLVNEGESAKLECLIDSYPPSKISWIFQNQILIENAESILINKIKLKKHLGYYICLANHSIFGIFNRTIRIALKNPPEIVEQNPIYSGYMRQSISIVCRISKDLPLQDFIWSRQDQKQIHSNTKYQIYRNETNDSIQSQLFIENLSKKDQGIYLCTAINQYGSSIQTFQLKVLHQQHFFIRNLIFYGSISFGIFLTFIFLLLILINYSKQNEKLRKKSSLTDQTLSSLNKKLNQINDSDETISSVQQYLIHDNQNKDQLIDSFQEQYYSFQNQSKRFSTVV